MIRLVTAGLLVGCRPNGQPAATESGVTVITPTGVPTVQPTDTPEAEATPRPTRSPAASPVASPTESPTVALTGTPTVAPVTTTSRADVVKIYPDVPSRVVQAHHAGVWNVDVLEPGAIRQILDAAIARLTGLEDPSVAWGVLFDADERIAVKVNTIAGSRHWTRIPLVMAVAERLQEVGVPAEQIVIFDRRTSELQGAGYPVNQDGPGVRCYGTGDRYTAGWRIADTDVKLSDILLGCDALINVPVLKQHSIAGISFAMKNHYGTFNIPGSFHGERLGRGLAELNGLSPIKDRTRLIIGDVLTIAHRGWPTAVTGDSILMSFDPVAHDAVGLQLYRQAMADEGRADQAATPLATRWLVSGAELGLGTDDLENVELVEVDLA